MYVVKIFILKILFYMYINCNDKMFLEFVWLRYVKVVFFLIDLLN